ncbi:hypothetical protein SCLCIDRAFT_1177625 [Scleroderma citrinum Foug A]|uniref:Uncharacterized protein n=1 Tax=Scleroderma citrinum Foug A TaxID=1036808 RepID=A0A0C3E1J5_9AGAM|nr:hypothetical protein SCLCIDRAFT_1177625 [Scleroderma citrinum Foug A]
MPSGSFFTHCHCELFHAQWKALLNDDFIQAYEHGMVLTCCDGIPRRLYPRIFTYSADYPEKVLIVNICNMGSYPCPCCLIPKDCLQDLATKRDLLQ